MKAEWLDLVPNKKTLERLCKAVWISARIPYTFLLIDSVNDEWRHFDIPVRRKGLRRFCDPFTIRRPYNVLAYVDYISVNVV